MYARRHTTATLSKALTRANHGQTQICTSIFTQALRPHNLFIPGVRRYPERCGGQGKATTPMRRQFLLRQDLVVVQGGRGQATFERSSPYGISKQYAVFPERFGNVPTTLGRRTKVFLNTACNEASPVAPEFTIRTNGIELYYPLNPGSDTVASYCPYSLDANDFKAWESFANFYQPLGACKNRVAQSDDSIAQPYTQRFYNRQPPAALEKLYRGTAGISASNLYPRDPIGLKTNGFSNEDFR